MHPAPLALLGLSLVIAAPAAAETRMRYVDLSLDGAAVPAVANLWSDYVEAGTKKWKASGIYSNRPFPANVLYASVTTPQGPVLVSGFLSLFDCEFPGSSGTLFARCPLRIVPPSGAVRTFQNACWQHVVSGVIGPDPERNYMSVVYDQAKHRLLIRTIENGQPIGDCDLLVEL